MLPTQNFIFCKSIFQNQRLSETKSARTHHPQTCTVNNVKGRPSNKVKIIADGNTDLHRRIKINRKL
jgi:hypothetical protein